MSEHCQQCGKPLSADGNCPVCLLKLGISHAAEQASLQEQLAQLPSIAELNPHFPQLQITRLVGRGGMGAIYHARQTALERDVALKIIAKEVASDPAFLERFEREAKTLARLSHPNIVTIFDFGHTSDGQAYLIMEFVDGINLREALASKSVGPEDAIELVSTICKALQYAHGKGVVHRDIKPENILVDKRGRVKIADFGLAKLLRRAPVEVALTSANQVMGTMHYMAPEQLERPLDVDHRADIYSLGVVLYELMTGDLPLGRFQLPSEKSLDARLDDVVLRTLDREPERRYQQISELKTDVEGIAGNPMPRPAMNPVVAAPVAMPIDATPVAEAVHTPQRKSGIRSVPFGISLDGVVGAKGLLRIDSRSLTFEYEVTESAEWTEKFSGFKQGMGRAVVPLDEIASAFLSNSWMGAKIVIQANSLDAVSKVPGNDRGKVVLSIDRADRGMALTLVNAIRAAIGEPEQLEAEGDLSRESTRPNWGLIIMGILFASTGGVMLANGIGYDSAAFLWTGLGIIIGGGGILSSAFSPANRVIAGGEIKTGNIFLGAVMFLLGFGLMIGLTAAGQFDRDGIVWVAFGLSLGGAGVFASIWPKAEDEEPASPSGDGSPRSNPQPGVQGKPGQSDETQRARMGSAGSALALLGLLNVIAYLFALAIWFAWFQPNMRSAGQAWATLGFGFGIAIPTLFAGMVMWPAGRALENGKRYVLCVFGALLGILPLNILWPISLPFCIWILIVVCDKPVRREFMIERGATLD